MSTGHMLSVDLGTSHTVAVMHWPDGRSRPLLFDGSPVLPSAIYLDDAGTIHVGKDAQRLAAGDPERYEPNPKQRIDEGNLLLGDREISVATAFAAILSRVARQAVEAVGGLPDAVLTCPAAWGQQRRSVLIDASAQAGYRPPQIVTEPVAAANYYSTSLDNSLPAGGALAVFDFGGGTLDIAVVGRDFDGALNVLADGGLDDLGGLDIDGGLVEHIGKTIASHDQDVWNKLSQPSTPIELRNRRALWDDVRGAKEMLSRTSVAPVNVPGLDVALHLTRAELEEVAKPLLARAVAETEQVLGQAGRDSSQLAGIFLVGGSSRMPLVAKMLHTQIGIAPTALEQPEIPVAEGALTLAAPPMTTPPQFTPPLGTNPNYTNPAMSPVTSPQRGLPPHSPSAPQYPYYDNTLQLGPPKKDRRKLYAALAGIAVLAIVIPLAVYWFASERYEQRPFEQLETIGSATPYTPNQESLQLSDFSEIRIREDRAIFSYTAGAGTNEQSLYMQAVDPDSGEELWDQSMTVDSYSSEFHSGDELLVLSQQNEISDGHSHTFFDVENGRQHESVRGASDPLVVGEDIVIPNEEGDSFTAYNSEGNEIASFDYTGEDESISEWGGIHGWEAEAEPRSHFSDAPRQFWVLTDDGTFHLNDLDSGSTTVSDRVESIEDLYFAYEEFLFVVTGDTDYSLEVYDLATLESYDSSRVRDFQGEVTEMRACGSRQICLEEEFMSGQNGYRVYDFADREFVYESDEQQEVSHVRPVGLHLAVHFEENGSGGDLRTQILDQNFDEVANVDGQFWPVDGASLLQRPFQDASVISANYFDEQFIGLGVDGDRQPIGSIEAYHPCAYTDTRVACFTEDGLQMYSFRD